MIVMKVMKMMRSVGKAPTTEGCFRAAFTRGCGNMIHAPISEKLTTHTFFRRLRERSQDGRRAALVCFTSPSCGACRAFSAVLPDVCESASFPDAGDLNLDVFEVDAGESPGLANEHEVVELPALFVYQAAEFHARLQASANRSSIISAVRAALKSPAEEPP